MKPRQLTQLLSGVGILLFGGLLIVTVLVHEIQPEIKAFSQAVATWFIMTISCCVINYIASRN